MKSTTTKETEEVLSQTLSDDLPEGWVQTYIGDVIRIQNGYAFPSKDFRNRGVPLIRQTNLAGNHVSLDKCVYLDPSYLSSKSDFILCSGDTLIGMSGSIGKLCTYDLEQPGLQNQRTGKIIQRIPNLIDSRYTFHFFATLEQVLLTRGKGLGVSNVSASDIEALPFSFPSLPEQRRIVAKIEELLKHVNASRDHLAKVPKILKAFRQSVLAAACSGRLTEDWREKHSDIEPATDLLPRIKKRRLESAETNKDRTQVLMTFEPGILEPSDEGLQFSDIPESWTACRIGAIGLVCNGSTPSRQHPAFWAGNISWVSSGEVRNNIISESRERITKEGYESSSVRLLPRGTVLIAMIGEGKTRGQSAILDIEATINQNIAAIILDHGLINPKYLWRWFQLQYEATREEGSGTGPQALNCQRVRELPFIVPPFTEQDEIVRRVEALFKLADKIEKRVEVATKRANKLTQAILGKAFRGELVPTEAELARREGRDYEPASVLLDRIRSERQGESEKPTNKQRTQRRTAKHRSQVSGGRGRN
jgi:type I restriction enzyme S subunit